MPHNLSDRTCNHCKKVFSYPSKLEIHLNNKRGCKPKRNYENLPSYEMPAIVYNYEMDNAIPNPTHTPNINPQQYLENRILQDFPDDSEEEDITPEEQQETEQPYREQVNVNEYFKNIVTNQENICDKCDKKFKHKKSLVRHQKLNRCNANDIDKALIARQLKNLELFNSIYDKIKNEQDPYIKETMFSILKENIQELKLVNPNQTRQLQPIITENIEVEQPIIIQDTPTQNANISLSNSNATAVVGVNNGTINNINNNNTYIYKNIQIVMPLGHENISFLSKNEIKKILAMNITDAIIELIIKIYDRVENQNFYKPNKSVNDISYLNNKCKFNVCNKHDFLKQLYLNSLYLYLRVVYEYKTQYKNEIKFEELLYYIQQYLAIKSQSGTNDLLTEQTNELYSKIKNFCLSSIENQNSEARDVNLKLRKACLNDKEVLDYFEDIYNKLSERLKEMDLDLEPDIDDEDFIEKLGEFSNVDLTDTETRVILKTQIFDDTGFKKLYNERITDEKKIVEENPKLGNIMYFANRERRYVDELRELQRFADDISKEV